MNLVGQLKSAVGDQVFDVFAKWRLATQGETIVWAGSLKEAGDGVVPLGEYILTTVDNEEYFLRVTGYVCSSLGDNVYYFKGMGPPPE